MARTMTSVAKIILVLSRGEKGARNWFVLKKLWSQKPSPGVSTDS